MGAVCRVCIQFTKSFKARTNRVGGAKPVASPLREAIPSLLASEVASSSIAYAAR